MLYKVAVFIIGIFILKPIHSENLTISPTESTTVVSTTPETYHFLPIYTLQYNVSKENSVELILNLLIEGSFNTIINPSDLLNFLDSRNFIVATKLRDINYEELIDIGNISMNDFLRSLTVHVPAKKIANIRSILDGFEIDFNEYFEYFVGDNDDNMLELLKSGNYTEAGIRNALVVMNLTEEQLITILKPIFLNEMVQLPFEVIIFHFDEEIKDLFLSSNITLDDITKYQSFNEMYQNFITMINNETYWATAISNNELVTISEAFLKVQKFSSFLIAHVKNVENNTVYSEGNIRLNNSFSIIAVNESLDSYIMIDYAAKENSMCYYLTQHSVGNLSVYELKNITLKDNIITGTLESAEVFHNLGSPLICEDRIYGLLISYNETHLKYLTFSSHNTNSEEPSNDSAYPEHYGHGSGQSVNVHLVLLFVPVIIYSSIV